MTFLPSFIIFRHPQSPPGMHTRHFTQNALIKNSQQLLTLLRQHLPEPFKINTNTTLMSVWNANEELFWCEKRLSRVDITTLLSLFLQSHDAAVFSTSQQHNSLNAFAFAREVWKTLLNAELVSCFISSWTAQSDILFRLYIYIYISTIILGGNHRELPPTFWQPKVITNSMVIICIHEFRVEKGKRRQTLLKDFNYFSSSFP